MNTLSDKMQRVFYAVATVCLVVAALYWMKDILIPLAMALLLAFVLTPLVNHLQQKGVGRIPSVLLVMTLALVFFGGILYIFFAEMRSLAIDLPNYRAQIIAKGKDLRDSTKDSWTDSIMQVGRDITAVFEEEESPPPPASEKVTVKVEQRNSVLPIVTSIAGSALEFLATAGLIFLMVLFILVHREDLRNRVLRVVGKGHMTRTTKAFDDASRRISRFLLMQAIVNGSYGAVLGSGLFLLGVPHALVWGLLAAVFRYIPYIGPWIGAIFPLALSIAVSPGWGMFAGAAALILVLELVSNNLMEPWLYGRSIGVSELALLVAAAFWTWLWGPLGLIMSTPLTACLVVISRYIPQLEPFHILLGDEKPLSRQAAFYQRLLAQDEDEASDLAEHFLADAGLDEVFDRLFLPALVHAREDFQRGLLEDQELATMLEFVGDMAREIIVPARALEAMENAADRPTIVGIPTHDRDSKLLNVFKEYAATTMNLEVLPSDMLPTVMLDKIDELKPRVLLLSAFDNTKLMRARLWCKRLKRRFPELRVMVAVWGAPLEDRHEQYLKDGGAYDVAATFTEVRTQLMTQARLDVAKPPRPPLAPLAV